MTLPMSGSIRPRQKESLTYTVAQAEGEVARLSDGQNTEVKHTQNSLKGLL